MTKRESPTPATTNDVDMAPTDQATKKQKCAESAFAYAQDEYKITSDFLKNSQFEVLYMATRARAEVIRHLLEFVGANYKSVTPVEWPAGKKDTPFGVLPVLTHIKPNGDKFVVSEVPALTRYLGRLFGLDGNNIEEDAFLDACLHSACDNVLNVMMTEIWMKPDPKEKANIDKAFEGMAPFFDGLERYLVKNGSNGYLLGEKTTYADFAWFEWIHYFSGEYPEHMKTFISQDHRPATYKMFKRLENNPRISAYIKGGRWEHRPATPLVGMYSAGVMTNDWEKSLEFYHKILGFEVVMNVEVTGQNGARYMEYFVNSGEKTKFTVYYGGPGVNFFLSLFIAFDVCRESSSQCPLRRCLGVPWPRWRILMATP
ncbi:MAG: glutathione S-transferase [Linnemannia gamsii]|nr:MAG: glutathione S-transferase [Linnemannia gamsii]